MFTSLMWMLPQLILVFISTMYPVIHWIFYDNTAVCCCLQGRVTMKITRLPQGSLEVKVYSDNPDLLLVYVSRFQSRNSPHLVCLPSCPPSMFFYRKCSLCTEETMKLQVKLESRTHNTKIGMDHNERIQRFIFQDQFFKVVVTITNGKI